MNKKKEKRNRLRWWQKRKRYIIMTFCHGEARHFSFFKFAKTEEEAHLEARLLVYNTLDWQAIIFRWNDREHHTDGFVGEYNTFRKEEKKILA